MDEAGGKKRFPLVFFVGYLAYTSIYLARLNFSVAATILQEQDILDKSPDWNYRGVYFSLVYALAKIPNGYMGDRFSANRVIVSGLLITSVSNLLIGFFPGFYVSAICRKLGVSRFGGYIVCFSTADSVRLSC